MSDLIYQIALGDPSVINELRIQGNAAIPTYRLEAACTFSQQHPVYNKSGVDTDVASMQAMYRENSYPTATIKPTFARETGVLQFEVNEGKRVEFKFVTDHRRSTIIASGYIQGRYSSAHTYFYHCCVGTADKILF